MAVNPTLYPARRAAEIRLRGWVVGLEPANPSASYLIGTA